jgi:phytoene synthase
MEYLYAKKKYTVRESYRECREIFRKSSKTYYLGALLFDLDKFFNICSFYGFVRLVDDIVDNDIDSVEEKDIKLKRFKSKFFNIYDNFMLDNLENESFWKNCGIRRELWAFFHTIYTIDIKKELLEKFFHSMEMDLYKFKYDTFSDLEEYMDGSACVIGEIMYLIIKDGKTEYYKKLEIEHDMNDYARQLGMAFQLTNFVRDIKEDFEMIPSRVYIPKEHQIKNRIKLFRYLENPNYTRYHNLINLLNFELNLSKKIYLEAQKGINLLDVEQRDNIEIAKCMYYEINNEIRRNKFVFLKTGKIKVSTLKKIKICYQKLGFLGIMNLAKKYIYYTYLI